MRTCPVGLVSSIKRYVNTRRPGPPVNLSQFVTILTVWLAEVAVRDALNVCLADLADCVAGWLWCSTFPPAHSCGKVATGENITGVREAVDFSSVCFDSESVKSVQHRN